MSDYWDFKEIVYLLSSFLQPTPLWLLALGLPQYTQPMKGSLYLREFLLGEKASRLELFWEV